MPDTSAIRPVDWAQVEDWLRARLAPATGLSAADLSQPMTVERCAGGHSNQTSVIRFGARDFVFRTSPPGPLPPAAHDMAREYRWLSTLHPILRLAPRPYLLCDDLDVTGKVFYVMERRHGIVIRDDEPFPIKGNPALRRRVGGAIVDTLAELHRIDVRRDDVSRLGKPSGFVARQVRSWTERWQRFKTSDVGDLDPIAQWLDRRIPPDPERPAIVHGDFKLDNLMLDAEQPDKVVAVFDWEMSALGDPLIDLGMLLAYWVPSAPADHSDALTAVTDRPGWFTRDEVVERYAGQSRQRLDTLPFFEVFAFFKIAVVIQQLYYRYVNGDADDPRFASFGKRVTYLARAALQRLERM